MNWMRLVILMQWTERPKAIDSQACEGEYTDTEWHSLAAVQYAELRGSLSEARVPFWSHDGQLTTVTKGYWGWPRHTFLRHWLWIQNNVLVMLSNVPSVTHLL